MDAHLFRRFTYTLTPIITGARIEKIQRADNETLIFSLHTNIGKRYLCLHHNNKNPFCFLTAQKITAQNTPTSDVMLLRKHLQNHRIRSCVIQWCSRTIWILVQNSQLNAQIVWLKLDLKNGANLEFFEKDTEPKEEIAIWPNKDQLEDAKLKWKIWPIMTPSLRRTLISMPIEEQVALIEDLRIGTGNIFIQYTNNIISSISAWPLSNTTNQIYEESSDLILESIEKAGKSLVLDKLSRKLDDQIKQQVLKQEKKLLKKIKYLEEDKIRLKKMKEKKNDAIAIQNNLWKYDKSLKMKSITIDDKQNLTIQLDESKTLSDNMARLFHIAKRGERGLTFLKKRLETIKQELNSIKNQNIAHHKNTNVNTIHAINNLNTLPKNVQLFISDDGFTLLRGKDAKGNDIIRKIASHHDIWLHVADGPGSHVIIKRSHASHEIPELTLIQAGQLAAIKSWQKDSIKAHIIYAEVRHVKHLKGAKPGQVAIDKIIETRDIYVDQAIDEKLLIKN